MEIDIVKPVFSKRNMHTPIITYCSRRFDLEGGCPKIFVASLEFEKCRPTETSYVIVTGRLRCGAVYAFEIYLEM